jgi:hypothetical protein
MKALFSLFLVVLLIGCGGSGMVRTQDPDWWSDPAYGDGIVSAATTEESQNQQTAIDKAVAGARAQIGQQQAVKVDVLVKKMAEEVGGVDAEYMQMFTNVTKQVSSEMLRATRIAKQETYRLENGRYKAYVLVIQNLGEAVAQRAKNEEILKARFRESQLQKQLDDETEKLNRWKKENNIQ